MSFLPLKLYILVVSLSTHKHIHHRARIMAFTDLRATGGGRYRVSYRG